MKVLKRIAASITAFAVMSVSTFAATVYVNEGKVNIWKEALETNQSRLYDHTQGYFQLWPGASGGHYTGINAIFGYNGSYSLETVFGKECNDLLFTDYASIASPEEMAKDSMKSSVTPNDIAIWNGFLFAVCSGGIPTTRETTEYYQYGNQKTVTYTDNVRDTSKGRENFLYVFDISRGENYGTALYGKWNLSDMGLGGLEKASFMATDKIDVDDDYIYITMNNGTISASVGDAADARDRNLAVFKNNISRENPEYISGTKKVKAPPRAEIAEDIESYTYGAKMIYDNSAIGEAGDAQTETAVIGNTHVMWFDKDISLAAANAKLDTMIYLTDIENVGGGVKISDTKHHYGLAKNLENIDATDVPLSALIKYETNSAWSETVNPYIRSIIHDGTLFYMLVTYSKQDGADMKYYRRIYVTDWSNPYRPKTVAMSEYEASEYTLAAAKGESVDIEDKAYYDDGYFYIAGSLGFDVVKLKNDDGTFGLNKISYIPYSESTTGYTSRPVIAAVGNYLTFWTNEGKYVWHYGTEAKVRLSADKTKIAELGGYGDYFRKHNNNRSNNIIRYGSKLYTIGEPSPTGALSNMGAVEVIDYTKLAPTELFVEPVGDRVTLPYKIKGRLLGLNGVNLTINGESVYIPATEKEGNYKLWEYEITTPGEYEIDAVGAVLKGYLSPKTAEHLNFTASASGTAEFGADYTETVNEDYSSSVTVSPYIKNGNFSAAAEVTPTLGIYSEGRLVQLIFGDKKAVNVSGETRFNDIKTTVSSEIVDFNVKLFWLYGGSGVTPFAKLNVLK